MNMFDFFKKKSPARIKSEAPAERELTLKILLEDGFKMHSQSMVYSVVNKVAHTFHGIDGHWRTQAGEVLRTEKDYFKWKSKRKDA